MTDFFDGEVRPHPDHYFLAMASLVATRGTCARRRVGCVLINEERHVLATGYNGPPQGAAHCIGKSGPCSGAGLTSGAGLDRCAAVHAEQNALLQCYDVGAIDIVYVTASPCVHCVKMLLNTNARRIVFIEDYPHGDAEKWWTDAGRQWHKYHTLAWPDPLIKEVMGIHLDYQNAYAATQASKS